MTTVGFTGTRSAITPAQFAELDGIFMRPGPHWLHHGDCIGADATADTTARAHGMNVTVHPPEDPKHRAWCSGFRDCKPAPYMVRNKCIVDSTDWLLAMPDGEERLRSGTWSTIRYAVNLGRRVMIVYPDGTIENRYVGAA